MVILNTFFPETNQQHRNDIVYLEGEPTEKQKSVIIGSDLDHLKSKALLTRIFFRFKTNKTLLGIQSEKAGIILIGMKTLIQCMEEIIYAPCDLKSPGD